MNFKLNGTFLLNRDDRGVLLERRAFERENSFLSEVRWLQTAKVCVKGGLPININIPERKKERKSICSGFQVTSGINRAAETTANCGVGKMNLKLKK